MLGYDFEIIYNKGKQNVVKIALSRKEEDTKALICTTSRVHASWVEEARIERKQDRNTRNLIQQLQQCPSTSNKYLWRNDSLWYKRLHKLFA